jgi:cytochrome c peroxidase
METRLRWPLVAVIPLAVVVTILAGACARKSSVPATVEAALGGKVPIPADNPQTADKVALGKLLFFDPRLSGPNTIACATCHNADKGLSDGRPRAIGASGEMTRNAMTLWNVAYMHAIHSDGSRTSLEDQAGKAITGPGMAQSAPALIDELNGVPAYRDRFGKVFPDGVTLTNVAKAIAAYERSLLTWRSPYDRYKAGDRQALTTEAKQGMDLFFSPRTGCSSCHVAPLFTDNQWHVLGVPQAGPKAVDAGRFDVTHNEADRGAFKTLTLRNVALSGPYMHDGVFKTLDGVVAFYAGGGGTVTNRDPQIKPLDLTAKEQAALVAFLRSLTDTTTTKIKRPKLP